MSYNIFEIPLNFISEYLTGWTIIILIVIIIYFIALRKYYINQEQFYQRNITNITNITPEDNSDDQDQDQDQDLENPERKEDLEKPERKGTDKDLKKPERKDSSNKKIEGFAVTSTQPSPTSTKASQPLLNSSAADKVPLANFINTTLFDNLQLQPEQVQQSKKFYNGVIINYINELSKLLKLMKNNEYLNVEKQFNIIITKGVDDIISFLSNTIKSMNILTRSSIKNDLLNILTNTLDNLINQQNIELTNYINELAMLNSTTIDYNSMTKNIDISRNKIEEYIEIDKLVANYGTKNSITENKINKILDKSFILPMYEKNFDRINQLVNSDFNNDYTKLADKYGTAYTEYLNQKKKEELNINPLEILSNIEYGVVNFLSDLSGNGNTNTKNNNTNNNNKIIEQYNAEYGHFNNKINQVESNPIPNQNTNIINNTTLNTNNIYKDSGNLGNYLINSNTQKQILEGFATSTSIPNTTNPNTTNPITTNPTTTKPNISNSKNNKSTGNIVSKLFSGEFLEYIMEVINDKLNIFYNAYDTKFNNGTDSNNYGYNSFKLDDNLIPAGFLLFILSMLFYFIDLTS
jgi:hypothetical protein